MPLGPAGVSVACLECMTDHEPEIEEAGGKGRARKRRSPRKITPDHLHNAALWYLERYASSAANLRRVLMRKVAKSSRYHGADPEDGAALIDELIVRFTASGLLDDAAYSEARALTLFRAGNSARAIRAKLRAKGVAEENIDSALEALHRETADPELAAALVYARRRRLGPYAPAEQRPEQSTERREKHLAAMARAGFGYDLARRVVEAEDADELELELEQAALSLAVTPPVNRRRR